MIKQRKGEPKTTRDHDKIRSWIEERGGTPARVKGTSHGGGGLLRVDFPGYSGKQSLEHIPWDEFFEKFDEKNLVFLYQEKTAKGNTSRFSKFISEDAA